MIEFGEFLSIIKGGSNAVIPYFYNYINLERDKGNIISRSG